MFPYAYTDLLTTGSIALSTKKSYAGDLTTQFGTNAQVTQRATGMKEYV